MPPAGQLEPSASAALRAHGVLSRGERARERARTLQQVVTPALMALLGDFPAVHEHHA